MLLITNFVELRVVAGRSRMREGSPQAISRRLCCAHGLEKNGMVRAGHGCGMASVNQTWPQWVNQMGKTHSKSLVAQHGSSTAWARHAMCESALKAASDTKDLESAINKGYKSSAIKYWCFEGFIHTHTRTHADIHTHTEEYYISSGKKGIRQCCRENRTWH